MGFTKTYSRQMHDAGRLDKVQALTQASTATRISNYGVTTITNSSGNNTFIMNPPVRGLRKTLVADSNSTGDIIVAQATTSITFYGSTTNIITFTTGGGARVVDLVGISASAWAVVSRTTGVTLAASTVSG